jgi:replicative DNA helicase
VKELIDSLPHDDFSEKAVLGILLLDNSYFNEVLKNIQPDDFFSEAHRSIASAVTHLLNKNQAADTITVSEYLKANQKLKIAGGYEYIESLVDSVPKNINIKYYIDSIKEKSTLRKIIATSAKTIQDTREPQAQTTDILSRLQERLINIAESGIVTDLKPTNETVPQTLNRIKSFQKQGKQLGIISSFYDLDKLVGGFQKSDLIIIAARPSMGKTALALNFALNIALGKDKKVAFFSIESTAYQIISRLLSLRSNIDLKTLITGYRKLSSKEWNKLELAASEIAKTSFYIDDSSALSIIDLKTRARRIHKEKGLDILFVDYLQLIRVSDMNRGLYDSRAREVALISASLKEIAKELDVPVVALAQLNRAPELRSGRSRTRESATDTIPFYQLSDLKESGAIEQDADIIMFLHREEQVNQDTGRTGEADIIISKNRNGPTGRIKLAFIDRYTKFANFEDSFSKLSPAD